MHIAIEGMDGSGKTSQAKAISKKLNGVFIAKSFHEMNDISGKYDSFVTIDSFTNGEIHGVYGMRQNYFWSKSVDEVVVTDRFYISNYWSRAKDLSIEYFKEISWNWGTPDVMIILYSQSDILYKRIFERNPNDKDLIKPQMADEAYRLMFSFVEKMGFKALVIDNSELLFDETTEIIEYAVRNGIDNCANEYCKVCKVIGSSLQTIENETGIFQVSGDELVSCVNKDNKITIPSTIRGIREKAFSQCFGELVIEISLNVQKISNFAFFNANIAEFIVDKNNQAFSSEKGMLLDKKKEKLISCPNLKQSVEELQVSQVMSNAFFGCDQLKTIHLGKRVEWIGYGAFGFCNGLKTLVADSKDVKFIAPGCFYGCNQLEDILIDTAHYQMSNGCLIENNNIIVVCLNGESGFNTYSISGIDYIYPYAYANRLCVQELFIDVKKIGAFAFMKTKIDKIILSEKVVDIGEQAFIQTEAEYVEVHLNDCMQVPEVWQNSFEESSFIVVESEAYEKFAGDRDWRKLILIADTERKTEGASCGNVCMKYIAEKKQVELPLKYEQNNIWIFEMAVMLKEKTDFEIKLFYYDSRLIKDYKEGIIHSDFYPISQMEKYISMGGWIEEYKFLEADYRQLKKDEIMILCLDSQILYRDNRLKGHNHYVMVASANDRGVYILSPGSDKVWKRFLTYNELEELMRNNGQWILSVC